MNLKVIERVFNRFNHNAKIVSIEELNSGHINDTYLVKTSRKPFYILQRINHFVFKDVSALISNKVQITKHLKSKKINYETLTFIAIKSGKYFYLDKNKNYWNLMLFIENSKSFDKVEDSEIAYEGGKLFGDFLNLTVDFDISKLVETIPNFHDMEFRFLEFDTALKSASKERLKLAKNQIIKVQNYRDEMMILNRLKKSGELPIRTTHSDTKISNALFTKDKKGLCVIDLDTVMPGIIHYDFGDAIRTICNTANEDEKDLKKVKFNMPFYKQFVDGFLTELGTNISNKEIETLPQGAKAMTFIMAIRMLTDFLNNDVYYKIAYPKHNLDRVKNQLYLIQKMELVFDEMKNTVSRYLKLI